MIGRRSVTDLNARGFNSVVGRAQMTDAELLAATRHDPGAFAAFYDRYEASILGYFARRANDMELAADLTAEVFAAALTAADRYRPEMPTAAAWLFTIAHNTLARSIRRGRVEARARHRIGIRDAFELDPGQVDRIEASVASDQWVTDLLDGLPPEQQQAIRARILDERPYHEIADRMQTSELVVRKRVSRGLASLRERLERTS
jgi:RNA polymerase sigma-70 factor (ECF subfamily)